MLDQIAAVIEDIPPAAAKTGALGTPEMVRAVARAATEFRLSPDRRSRDGEQAWRAARRRSVGRTAAVRNPGDAESSRSGGAHRHDRHAARRRTALREWAPAPPSSRAAIARATRSTCSSTARNGRSSLPRGSTPAIRMARAAPTRRRLPPASRAGSGCATPWRAPNGLSMRPFGAIPDWDMGTGRSTTLRRSDEIRGSCCIAAIRARRSHCGSSRARRRRSPNR